MFSSNTSQVSNDAVYVEDVFSTYVYTGNGSTQTITNGIDLSTKGGLVWTKTRSSAGNHLLRDTARGTNYGLYSNLTNSQINGGSAYSLSLGTSSYSMTSDDGDTNATGITYASWTFRKQPKFFDVVTYTGNGSSPRDIAHSLGSVPGCIFLKRTDSADNWIVYHRSIDVTNTGGANTIFLNLTVAAEGPYNFFGYTVPTSTTFKVGSNANINGATYVAYLFAHDAGGFGLTGTDNVISCGSMTGTASNQTISLGWEPQFILYKRTNTTGDWQIADTMRGWLTGAQAPKLQPNLTAAEGSASNVSTFKPTASGMEMMNNANGETYIYIAIRRGPMKVPTSGTSVFKPTKTSAADGTAITVGFPTDSQWANYLAGDGNNTTIFDRLRGMSSTAGSTSQNRTLFTSNTSAESSSFGVNYFTGVNNTGWVQGSYASGVDTVRYDFRRAPSFFDEVCYTGTGSATTVTHNLGVAPELMIVKCRNNTGWWVVYPNLNTSYLALQSTDAISTAGFWNNTSPTSSVFTVSSHNFVNGSGFTYTAYLFASCPGVQYINSYVGDGTTGRTINCGFTGGARFVCIKATSTSGSWWTFDSARGIVTNNDPALQLNSTAAEITSADAIDTASSGFIVNQEATCSLNASGVTYLVWAIA